MTSVSNSKDPLTRGFRHRLRQALRHPGMACHVLHSLLKGRCFLLGCRLRGLRVEGGRSLRINGRLKVRGPGRLVLARIIHEC
jgi:hypothetical protein